MEIQSAKLATLLGALSPEEIVAFDAVLRSIHQRSDHWDLWSVAYIIINGGCSDDAFEYFRRWLLAREREVFERTVRDPGGLAESIPADNDYEPDFEAFFYITDDVYEAKKGNRLKTLVPRPSIGKMM